MILIFEADELVIIEDKHVIYTVGIEAEKLQEYFDRYSDETKDVVLVDGLETPSLTTVQATLAVRMYADLQDSKRWD